MPCRGLYNAMIHPEESMPGERARYVKRHGTGAESYDAWLFGAASRYSGLMILRPHDTQAS